MFKKEPSSLNILWSLRICVSINYQFKLAILFGTYRMEQKYMDYYKCKVSKYWKKYLANEQLASLGFLNHYIDRSRPEKHTNIVDLTGILYFLAFSSSKNSKLANIRISKDFVSKRYNCKNPKGQEARQACLLGLE